MQEDCHTIRQEALVTERRLELIMLGLKSDVRIPNSIEGEILSEQ